MLNISSAEIEMLYEKIENKKWQVQIKVWMSAVSENGCFYADLCMGNNWTTNISRRPDEDTTENMYKTVLLSAPPFPQNPRGPLRLK